MSGYSGRLRNRGFCEVAAAFAAAVAWLLIGATGCVRKTPEKTNLVLAVVGEKEIRESDFRRELGRSSPTVKGKYRRDRMALLNQMLEEEVIYQKAVKEDLLQDPEAQRRLAWARTDAAIERLKEVEIFKDIKVTEQEIEKRYGEEVSRGGSSEVVVSLLYLSASEDAEADKAVRGIKEGFREGLSFPQIAERHGLPYDRDPVPFDSPRFSQQLAPQLQEVARRMPNRSAVALSSGGTTTYLVKDVEPLSACYRRIRSLIRDEKQNDALREWLAAGRASSAIRIHDEALENTNDRDAVAAEVNGVAITVRQLEAWREGLAKGNKNLDTTDAKALVNEAIDREILRQEAEKRKLDEDKVVKETVPRGTRRILVELLTERNVTGLTDAVRAKSRTDWITGLRKEIGVKVFPENVKKMALPPSEEIEEVFGTQPR